jgi:hypothetical protein
MLNLYRRINIGKAALVALVALAVILGYACGGGDDNATSTATATGASSTAPGTSQTSHPATSAPATATGEATNTVSVDKTFWYAGFKVTLGKASFLSDDPSAGTGSGVNIEATFENTGTDTKSFQFAIGAGAATTELVLVQGGNNYINSTGSADFPDVPGTLSQAGMITFAVKSDFNFNDAFLLVGNPTYDQPRVPLGSGGGEFVSLEPRPVTVSGTVTAGANPGNTVNITISGGELRADLPTNHTEAAKGRLLLNLQISATTPAGSEGNLLEREFTLAMPDGTAAGPGLGGFYIASVNPGSSALLLDFDVNDPPQQGTYTLTLTHGDSSGQMTFQIP